MPTPEFLHDLLTAAGPSGHETSPARVWRDWCSRFCGDVGVDRVGSSWARVGGIAGGPTLAVVGHIDEIGFHVTYIDDDGFIRFGEVGGWDPAVLVGQRLVRSARTATVRGVIGTQTDPPAQGRGAQEGARDQGPAHRHRRRDGDEAVNGSGSATSA